MKIWQSIPAGTPHPGDQGAFFYIITFFYQKFGISAVNGGKPVAVGDDQCLAESVKPGRGEYYFTAARGQDRGVHRRLYVNTFIQHAPGIPPERGNDPAFYRPREVFVLKRPGRRWNRGAALFLGDEKQLPFFYAFGIGNVIGFYQGIERDGINAGYLPESLPSGYFMVFTGQRGGRRGFRDPGQARAAAYNKDA